MKQQLCKMLYSLRLGMLAASASLLAACGGGGGDTDSATLAAAIAVQAEQARKAEEAANAPVKVFTYRYGALSSDHAGYLVRREMRAKGIEPLAIACRGPNASLEPLGLIRLVDPDFPVPPEYESGGITPGGGIGPTTYVVVDIRTRDLPKALEAGFRHPLSQRVLNADAPWPCGEIAGEEPKPSATEE